jgi:uncharacterized protein
MLSRTALALGALPIILVGCAAASSSPIATGNTGSAPALNDPEPTTGGATNGGSATTGGTTGSANTPPRNPNRTFQLTDLEVVEVKIDGHPFRLWLMDTFAKRQEGMMFLQNSDFKDDQGMIFVFPDSARRNFWMKNTLVPLDIAYINSNKTILNVLTMKALDIDTPYESRGAAMYVIEVRAGIFGKLGIGANDKVEIPATVVSKD